MPNTRNVHPPLPTSIVSFLLSLADLSSVASADDVTQGPRRTSHSGRTEIEPDVLWEGARVTGGRDSGGSCTLHVPLLEPWDTGIATMMAGRQE